jgi:hypothetical protein
MRPLVSIILIVYFLVSGGLGAGAPLVLCTESDGAVHLESPFNRCCDTNESQKREHKPNVRALFSHGAVAIISFDQCGSCVDVLLVNSIQHDAAIPAVKTDGHAQRDMVTPLSTITAGVADIDQGVGSPIVNSAVWGSAAHVSIDSVVLRC